MASAPALPNVSTPSLPTTPTLPAAPNTSAPTGSLPGAGSPQGLSTDQQKQQDQMKMREALGDAYAALVAQQNTQSFVAFTFEEAAANQLDRLTGPSTRLRPNEVDRVTRIRDNLTTAIAAIKKIPPEAFLEPNEGRDVNTPSGGAGTPGTLSG